MLSPKTIRSPYVAGSLSLGSDALTDEFRDSITNKFYCDITT
jgi:hypothetical protein